MSDITDELNDIIKVVKITCGDPNPPAIRCKNIIKRLEKLVAKLEGKTDLSEFEDKWENYL